jgi:hypothetical protein
MLPRVREYIRAVLVLVTLGWDFPVITWWRSRPRVVARIEKRRAALKRVLQPVKWLLSLPIRFVKRIW